MATGPKQQDIVPLRHTPVHAIAFAIRSSCGLRRCRGLVYDEVIIATGLRAGALVKLISNEWDHMTPATPVAKA